MFQILDFKKSHIEEAEKLAVINYNDERANVADLPDVHTVPDLDWFAENGKGIIAVENGKMLGYLCYWGPYDNAFSCNPSIKGVWSPAHCNCAVGYNKTRIYKEMYQALAEKWVDDGALIHAITLYAHDDTAIKAFFTYGFGLRCIDAIKLVKPCEFGCPEGVSFAELFCGDAGRITDLNNMLIGHLGKSPCFLNYHYSERTPEAVISEAEEDGIRYFIATKQDEIVAYIKVANDGEHFACCNMPDLKNICGAFLLPQYRGMGIFNALFFYTESVLANEGIKRLGVDFESFNPTAYGYWLKHFKAFTNSVVRRIDERRVV